MLRECSGDKACMHFGGNSGLRLEYSGRSSSGALLQHNQTVKLLADSGRPGVRPECKHRHHRNDIGPSYLSRSLYIYISLLTLSLIYRIFFCLFLSIYFSDGSLSICTYIFVCCLFL